MRRYVIEVVTTLSITDEVGAIVGSRSSNRKVAVDIKGRERDLIVKNVLDEIAEDVGNEMPIFAQNMFRSITNT